jgi:HTH-type transcriptional regulator/antitoxin HigA
MEQLGIKPMDLAKVLGFRSRETEVLNIKRKLSLDMVRRLNRDLHIPTTVLIQEY